MSVAVRSILSRVFEQEKVGQSHKHSRQGTWQEHRLEALLQTGEVKQRVAFDIWDLIVPGDYPILLRTRELHPFSVQ